MAEVRGSSLPPPAYFSPISDFSPHEAGYVVQVVSKQRQAYLPVLGLPVCAISPDFLLSFLTAAGLPEAQGGRAITGHDRRP